MTARRREAFLALPFGEESEELRELLERVLRGRGFMVSGMEPAPGERAGTSISEAVRRAELVIADVTRPTTNVMYELGIAQAMNKPLLLLAQESSPDLPSDLQARVATYDLKRVGSVERTLEYWLRDTLTA